MMGAISRPNITVLRVCVCAFAPAISESAIRPAGSVSAVNEPRPEDIVNRFSGSIYCDSRERSLLEDAMVANEVGCFTRKLHNIERTVHPEIARGNAHLIPQIETHRAARGRCVLHGE